MRPRQKLILLLVLVGALVGVNVYWRSSSSTLLPLPGPGGAGRAARGAAAPIPDAELHLERLAAAGSVRAADIRRNVFEYGSAPAAREPRLARVLEPETPPEAAPPPPPRPPLRCYGFAEGSQGGRRQVLLTDGEAVFVAGAGEVVAGRFRVLTIAERSVEVEELAGRKRWVIPLEVP